MSDFISIASLICVICFGIIQYRDHRDRKYSEAVSLRKTSLLHAKNLQVSFSAYLAEVESFAFEVRSFPECEGKYSALEYAIKCKDNALRQNALIIKLKDKFKEIPMSTISNISIEDLHGINSDYEELLDSVIELQTTFRNGVSEIREVVARIQGEDSEDQ